MTSRCSMAPLRSDQIQLWEGACSLPQLIALQIQIQKKRQPEGWRFYAAVTSLRLLATKTRALAGTGRCATALARRLVRHQFQAWAFFRRGLGWALGAGVVGRATCGLTATGFTAAGRARRAWRTFAFLTRCRGWTTLTFNVRLTGNTPAGSRCIQRRAQGASNALGARNRARRFTLHTVELVFALGVHLRHGDWRQADFGTEDVDFVLAHFAPAAHRQVGVQEHRAETHALQAADHQALGFPQATYFTVTAFHHHAVIPVVETFAAWSLLDVGELGRAIFQHDAGLEARDHLVIDFATHTHRVFTVHLVGWVHQAVGQFTVGGEHQQAGGVDVETTDVDPAAFFWLRHLVEHGRTAFRVVTGANLAIGLVVHDHAAHRFGGLFTLDDLAINGDCIVQVDALAEGGLDAVDLDALLGDPGFDVAARAHADTRQHLLQFFACRADFLAVVLVFVVHLKHLPVGRFRRGLKSVESGALGEYIAKGSRIIRAWRALRIRD